MLDDLILLSEGRTIYIGKAAEANDWFQAKGFTCPIHYSVADFFLDTISKVGAYNKLWKHGYLQSTYILLLLHYSHPKTTCV